MTDTPVTHRRNPLLDPPKQKGFLGVPLPVLIGVGIFILALHALMFAWLAAQKFKLKEFNYVDESVEVELVEPIPPPPKLQVREPQIIPNAPPPPITLPIEPTKKEDRVEYTAPPVIVPGPPPPPAPPAPARPSTITNPQWSRRPQVTARDIPDRAMTSSTSGSATVRCTAQANGRPANCQVVSEDPSGFGFGRAAVRVVERGQLSPRTVDGAAENAQFTATIRFQLQ